MIYHQIFGGDVFRQTQISYTTSIDTFQWVSNIAKISGFADEDDYCFNPIDKAMSVMAITIQTQRHLKIMIRSPWLAVMKKLGLNLAKACLVGSCNRIGLRECLQETMGFYHPS